MRDNELGVALTFPMTPSGRVRAADPALAARLAPPPVVRRVRHGVPMTRLRLLRAGALARSLLAAACEPALPVAYLRRTAGDTLVLAASPIGEMDELGLYDDLPPPIAFGWNRIVARDTLEALLTVNSTGFFIHQG